MNIGNRNACWDAAESLRFALIHLSAGGPDVAGIAADLRKSLVGIVAAIAESLGTEPALALGTADATVTVALRDKLTIGQALTAGRDAVTDVLVRNGGVQ